MRVAQTERELRESLGATGGGAAGVFVPTMGALHEGHASLIRQAAGIAHTPACAGQGGRRTPQPVIVSIFVNPTQFNDPKDFARYPKTLDADLAICRAAGATVVFVPDVATIYPSGPDALFGPGAEVPLPAVAREPGLEDALRPGHFAGVCRVVARLFELVQPAAAIFGEKDWQQLQVVSAMTRERGYPIEIIPGPTIREPDGLAMSSRNRFLSPSERTTASAISWALKCANKCARLGEAERVMHRILERAGLGEGIEYAVVRDARTLGPCSGTTSSREPGRRPLRSLIAARVGSVRLIDNAPWNGAVAL